jgi:hypothetical protein
MDEQHATICKLLDGFRPGPFRVGLLAKNPGLLVAFGLLDAAPEILAEYVKTFSRRLNYKGGNRCHYPVHALGDDTDNGDGNGVLFVFIEADDFGCCS